VDTFYHKITLTELSVEEISIVHLQTRLLPKYSGIKPTKMLDFHLSQNFHSDLQIIHKAAKTAKKQGQGQADVVEYTIFTLTIDLWCWFRPLAGNPAGDGHLLNLMVTGHATLLLALNSSSPVMYNEPLTWIYLPTTSKMSQ
jgi:hypothetical protein